MYKIIRCGDGFDPVIMVSLSNAGLKTPDAEYYRYASWRIDGCPPGIFNKITRAVAVSYFSGIANRIGFEWPPENIFTTLEEALQFVLEIQKR